MTRVLIVGDARKGGTKEVIGDFENWLSERVDDVDVILGREASLAEIEADLICVVGGDGSILSAARRMGGNQIPTLGINIGRLGFLTACGPDDARQVTEAVLAGEFHVEERAMLHCSVRGADGSVSEPILVLNDAVVTRRSTAGIVRLVALRNGYELAAYSGDGVIVATPTGSTAYSLAAGGPVLAPDMDAVVVTPMASHSLTLRPLVVPLDQGLDLQVQECGGADVCNLLLDGQVAIQVAVDDLVQVRPAPVKFRLMVPHRDSFFRVFREKFGWSDVPRRPAENR